MGVFSARRKPKAGSSWPSSKPKRSCTSGRRQKSSPWGTTRTTRRQCWTRRWCWRRVAQASCARRSPRCWRTPTPSLCGGWPPLSTLPRSPPPSLPPRPSPSGATCWKSLRRVCASTSRCYSRWRPPPSIPPTMASAPSTSPPTAPRGPTPHGVEAPAGWGPARRGGWGVRGGGRGGCARSRGSTRGTATRHGRSRPSPSRAPSRSPRALSRPDPRRC